MRQPNQPVTSLIMPDAALEYWAEVYLANPLLAKLGITFELFLKQPRARIAAAQRLWAAVQLTDCIEQFDLLPKQRAVCTRLEPAFARGD